MWLDHAVAGLASPCPWWLLALLGQAIIVGSTFGVTGIPPTEHRRSAVGAYRDYQKRVSRFIPMPPTSARPDP